MKKTTRSLELGIFAIAAFGVISVMLFGGCSAVLKYFDCFGCTETYVGSAKELTVRERVSTLPEHGRGSPPESRVTKLVAIDNPYDKNVHVFVDCGMDSEWDIVIAARRTQLLLVGSTLRHADDTSCVVRNSWYFTDEPPTYGPGSQ